MTKTITCPSGLSGEIQGLKGKNLGLLDDKQVQRGGLFLDKIMEACWLSTTAPGPYQLGKDGELDWQKVLTGDRFYALLQVRCLMRGSEFRFEADCKRTASCKPFDVPLDLLKDLPVKLLSETDMKAFVEGNRIAGTMPDGTRFWFQLPTGEAEVRAAKFGRQARNIIPAICSRIIEIEGVAEGGLRSYFDEADINLPFEVLASMDEHDCGVETDFEVECPNCGGIQTMQIPFDQSFLVVSPKWKKH